MKRRDNQNFDRQLIELCESPDFTDKIPLTHICPTHTAREIFLSGKLITSHCNVFKRDMLYFFILRPAYRFKDGETSSDELSRFPVVFVLRSDAVRSPSHVYPFDTGGAAADAFAERADANIYLDDYALEFEQTAPARFIKWAFGNLDAYYASTLKDDIDEKISFHKWVVASYIKIARLGVRGHNKRDHRASTVEIASNDNVDLASNLMLVVCPYQWIEPESDKLNEKMHQAIEKLGADIEYYQWAPHTSPDSYQDDLMDICRRWYVSQGVLNG